MNITDLKQTLEATKHDVFPLRIKQLNGEYFNTLNMTINKGVCIDINEGKNNKINTSQPRMATNVNLLNFLNHKINDELSIETVFVEMLDGKMTDRFNYFKGTFIIY